MAKTHKAMREDVFKLVEEYKLTWHGLYQGRTGEGGHTVPVTYDPDAYGAADWNVRLFDASVKPAIYGYGGGPSVPMAVARAIAEIELKRKKAKEFRESTHMDKRTVHLLRQMGVTV